MLNYFRRLKLTNKVLVFSFFSILVLLAISILFNIFIFDILGQEKLTLLQEQVFSTINLLFNIFFLIVGVLGSHYLLTEMVNFPYNEHKLETATAIFMVLSILLAMPAALTVEQFELSFSIKLVLDVTFLLVSAIYSVLASSIFYAPSSGTLTRRYARWSVAVFVFFFGLLVVETLKRRIDPLIMLVFVGIYLLAILLILIREIGGLIASQSTNPRENKAEIAAFVVLVLAVIGFKFVDIFLW